MLVSKILVVDDEPAIVDFITDTLSDKGYEIICAFDGEKALKILGNITPDLILIDWDMPLKNGIDTIVEIKKIPETASVPIIMITGRMTSMADLKMAFDAGVVDFIRKPFSPIELLARTNSMLLLSEYYKESVKNKDWELTLITKNSQKNETLINEALKSIDNYVSQTKGANNFWHKELVDNLNRLKHSLQNNSWDQFETYFKNVHPNFSDNLLNAFPKLSTEEIKLCYFLRLNMNSKEIASITNKESASIDIARYRLRKKLDLDKDEKLHEFLMRF